MFDDWPIIHTYTRAQALADGVLVDISAMAHEVGFQWSVAVTQAVWAIIQEIPTRFEGIQSVDGRLWDLVWIASLAVRRNSGTETLFRLIMHHGQKTYQTFKLVAGPGDVGEPVITIMLPNED